MIVLTLLSLFSEIKHSYSYSYVKWKSTMSSKFHVTNGVRQGGVISPLLLNVHITDLSKYLNKSGVGGSMNGTFVNRMLYVDDICIISLSSSGLQRLLNIIM